MLHGYRQMHHGETIQAGFSGKSCFCTADMHHVPAQRVASPQPLALVDIKPDRVWTLKELEILHDMAKPIAVVVDGYYEDPHW